MCEWLSHGEYCDVKLLCGGRSFNAHRAVLASVSAFLRRILLSCPEEETTTLIVLPDFDLDAMSSVLYYIYNGEVLVQKQQLGYFLDIIQAMQIYIDSQYIPKGHDSFENEDFPFNTFSGQNDLQIFSLTRQAEKDQKLYKIKQNAEIQSVLSKYSQSDFDVQDNEVRLQNGSEFHKTRLGNLKSPYGDRQRNSFLRDLYIETYPRNGNVNGPTGGVLAITNECYRPPASVLSVNANGQHLEGNDTLFQLNNNPACQISPIARTLYENRSSKHVNCVRDCKIVSGNSSNSLINHLKDMSDMTFIYGNSENAVNENAVFPSDKSSILSHQLNEMTLQRGLHGDSLNIRQSILEAFTNFDSIEVPNSMVIKHGCKQKRNLKSRNATNVIFNQVLENPWSPRKPDNFRPVCRRENIQHTQNLQLNKMSIVNDNNNNVQTTIAEHADTENIVMFDEKTTVDLDTSLVTTHDSFKCAQCNQMFMSNESLAVHSRTHSANARYTCSDCGKNFSQLRNFKYHMSIHRGTKEFSATCTVCGKYFNDRGYLSSHMKIHRNRKEYKCGLCPKSFNQRVAYNMHVRIHTGVKPHVCEECGKAFSRKMLLKQHQRTHSGERPYACLHCDKRFADRSNMMLHLRLHTGVKPFSCSMCPKSFTKKHHLKSHLNFHTGSKPYSCPRCNLAFTQSSNMRTHFKKCSAAGSISIVEPKSEETQNSG